jgi:uncharacterized membrane protein
MTHVRITEHFDAPIDRVFELGIDLKRYPEWNVSFSQIKEVTGPPDQVGTKFISVMKVLGRQIEGQGEIVQIDRPQLLKISSTGPEGASLIATYRLTTVGTGTDFETEIDYELPAGVLGQIADKLFMERAVERDLRHSLENFKALVETNVAVPV